MALRRLLGDGARGGKTRQIDAKRGQLGVQCRPLGSSKRKFRLKTVGGYATERHELTGKDGGPIKALTLEMLVNASFGVVEERRAAKLEAAKQAAGGEVSETPKLSYRFSPDSSEGEENDHGEEYKAARAGRAGMAVVRSFRRCPCAVPRACFKNRFGLRSGTYV